MTLVVSVLSKNLVTPGFFPLRSVAIVVMDDPSQNVATAHRSMDSAICLGDGNLLFDALIGTCGVEERKVFTHDTP